MPVVPTEPTAEMLQGGCAKHTPGQPMSEGYPECPSFVRRRRIWADMIAAAPPSSAADRIALLEEALRPFAALGKALDVSGFGIALFDNSGTAFEAEWTHDGETKRLTWGEFRQAAQALAETEVGGE